LLLLFESFFSVVVVAFIAKTSLFFKFYKISKERRG
jgi:hypothetical protein